MNQDSERLRSATDQLDLPSSHTSPVAINQSSTVVGQPLGTVSSTQISPGGSGSKPMHGSSVAYSPANNHAQQIRALSTMLAKQQQAPLETKVKVHM